MNPRFARSIYLCLISMHPQAFRARFGNELLQVFDDAQETYGSAWLLVDLIVSVGRQRVLRSESGAELATPQAGLISGVYVDSRPPHLTCPKLGLAFLLTLLSVFLFPLPDLIHHSRPEVHHGVTYRR